MWEHLNEQSVIEIWVCLTVKKNFSLFKTLRPLCYSIWLVSGRFGSVVNMVIKTWSIVNMNSIKLYWQSRFTFFNSCFVFYVCVVRFTFAWKNYFEFIRIYNNLVVINFVVILIPKPKQVFWVYLQNLITYYLQIYKRVCLEWKRKIH